MGAHKTQRTEQRTQAAKRYVIAEEVSNRIEQHNFDSLVRKGVIVKAQAERDSFLEAGGGVGEGGGRRAVSTCQSLKY